MIFPVMVWVLGCLLGVRTGWKEGRREAAKVLRGQAPRPNLWGWALQGLMVGGLAWLVAGSLPILTLLGPRPGDDPVVVGARLLFGGALGFLPFHAAAAWLRECPILIEAEATGRYRRFRGGRV